MPSSATRRTTRPPSRPAEMRICTSSPEYFRALSTRLSRACERWKRSAKAVSPSGETSTVTRAGLAACIRNFSASAPSIPARRIRSRRSVKSSRSSRDMVRMRSTISDKAVSWLRITPRYFARRAPSSAAPKFSSASLAA